MQKQIVLLAGSLEDAMGDALTRNMSVLLAEMPTASKLLELLTFFMTTFVSNTTNLA